MDKTPSCKCELTPGPRPLRLRRLFGFDPDGRRRSSSVTVSEAPRHNRSDANRSGEAEGLPALRFFGAGPINAFFEFWINIQSTEDTERKKSETRNVGHPSNDCIRFGFGIMSRISCFGFRIFFSVSSVTLWLELRISFFQSI